MRMLKHMDVMLYVIISLEDMYGFKLKTQSILWLFFLPSSVSSRLERFFFPVKSTLCACNFIKLEP